MHREFIAFYKEELSIIKEIKLLINQFSIKQVVQHVRDYNLNVDFTISKMKSFKKNLSILSEDKQKELISSKTDWAFLQALKANYEFFEKDLEIKSYRFQAYLTDIKKIEDYFINPDKISQMKSLLGETYS